MQNWKHKTTLFITVCLLGLSPAVVSAQEAPYIKYEPSVANRILDRAYRYVGSLNSFVFEAITINDDLVDGKILAEVKHSEIVSVERPGNLFIDVAGDSKNRRMTLHKGLFTMWDKKKNYYGQIKTPKSIDDTLDYIFDRYDIKTPLANILYSNVAERLDPKTKGYYFGIRNVGRTPCDYIGFSNKKEELQMWIARGDKPLIRKFIIIDKTGKREMRSTTILRWHSKKLLTSEQYRFRAPRGAIKVDIETPEGRD